jgi:hypothetical protein
MNSKIDIAAGLSYLSSGVLATVAVTIGDAFPDHVKQIVAVAAIITLFAGLGTRLFKNPTPPTPPKDQE